MRGEPVEIKGAADFNRISLVKLSEFQQRQAARNLYLNNSQQNLQYSSESDLVGENAYVETNTAYGQLNNNTSPAKQPHYGSAMTTVNVAGSNPMSVKRKTAGPAIPST